MATNENGNSEEGKRADQAGYSISGVSNFESFSEWIDSTALSTGLAEEDILRQLIAAYWSVNEQSDESSPSRGESQWNSESRSFPTDRNSLRSGGEIDRGTISADLDDLYSQIDDVRTQIEELADRSVADETIENLELVVGTHTIQLDHLAEDLETLNEATEAGTRALERHDSLSRSHESLVEEHTELSSALTEFRNGIDGEFTHLRTILEHVFERFETNEELIGELKADTERIARERDRLIDLKRCAAQIGVDTATCESCETQIDVRMLADLVCPQCGCSFDGVTQHSKWFGFATSDVLTVLERSPNDQRGTALAPVRE